MPGDTGGFANVFGEFSSLPLLREDGYFRRRDNGVVTIYLKFMFHAEHSANAVREHLDDQPPSGAVIR